MVQDELLKIPSELIRSALRETIENKLKLKKYSIKLNSASKAGENNFIGEVFRVTIFEEDNNGNSENPQEHNLILKIAPQNVVRRERWNTRAGFLREMYMYNEVLPLFREFEVSKGLTNEQSFNEYPKCYGTVDFDLNECVLLEDLTIRRFTMIDRHTEDISIHHVQLSLRCLAKFHAISFAIRDQNPAKFQELATTVSTEILLRRDSQVVRDHVERQAKYTLNLVSDKNDTHLLALVNNLLQKHPLDVALDCLDPKTVGSAAIITHGDCWQNNFLYRNDDNGLPNQACLLDWQIARYTSPMIDLVHFLFCCTTKEFRDAHYDECLNIYHETLSSQIHRLGSSPEKLFPYKLMMQHLRKVGKFGLIFATLLLPILTSDVGNSVDLDKAAEQNDTEQKDKKTISSQFVTDESRIRFDKRLKDIVVDMERLNYI